MRILRAHVPDLGPLRGLELELAPGTNVIHGPNEAGKTTLLDFLLSHLFRWERRTGTRLSTLLGELDRFGDPSGAGGSVELLLEGEVHGYPGGPSLLHHLGLEHAGLAGLFCVRSGEMELPEKESGAFWREMKKVLSGLPEGVESLRKAAHGAAGLTAKTAELSDSGTPGLRTRYRELSARIRELSGLADRLDEISEIARRVARTERRRRALLRARDREIASLERERREVATRLERLPELPPEALERWEDAAGTLSRLEAEIEAARADVAEAEEEARRRERARERALEAAKEARDRLRRARELRLAERSGALQEAPGALERLADPLHRSGTALLLAGVALTFFTPSDVLREPVWILALAATLAAGSGLLVAGRRGRGARRERREARERLAEDAASCGWEELAAGAAGESGPAVATLPDRVRALESRVVETEREAEVAGVRAEAAAERLAERRAELGERKAGREAAAAEIARLRESTGLGTLAEARERARTRRELGDRARERTARLEGLAGPDPSAWSAALPGEDAPGPDSEPPPWDAEEKAALDEELERLRARHRELRRAFDRAGLETPEDALPELEECRAEKERIELDREAGRLAGRIFASMDEALEEQLAAALDREGPLSVGGLARRVTGRHVAVRRTDEEGLVVTDREGRTRPLAHLSRGTRDQIYLAIRVGLAGAALEAAGLEGDGGFLLLDDAFLTADWARRGRLVEACARLSEEGWQVVYLTCDDHLRDRFVEAGAELHEL